MSGTGVELDPSRSRWTTQRDAFDERLTRLESEVGDIKTLLGENAIIQSRILNMLDRIDQRMDRLEQRVNRLEQRLGRVDQRLDRVEQRTKDIARYLGVPPPNGAG